MSEKRSLAAIIAVCAAFVVFSVCVFVSNLSAPRSYEITTEREPDERFIASEAPESLVNINTATFEELYGVPGIGETRAAAIIEYREEHGAFLSTADIMQVKGIGEGTYEQICGYITVGEASE